MHVVHACNDGFQVPNIHTCRIGAGFSGGAIIVAAALWGARKQHINMLSTVAAPRTMEATISMDLHINVHVDVGHGRTWHLENTSLIMGLMSLTALEPEEGLSSTSWASRSKTSARRRRGGATM